MATHTGVLTLGIQEVTSGSVEVALETLQEILDKFSEATLKSGYSDAGKKTVANIKSTMSVKLFENALSDSELKKERQE